MQPGQRHSVLHIYFHQRHSLPTNSRVASENDQGASRMTHQGGGLAAKPDNWSPVPGTHMAGRENQFRHIVFWTSRLVLWYVCPAFHTNKHGRNLKNILIFYSLLMYTYSMYVDNIQPPFFLWLPGSPPISLPISCLVYFYNLWSQLILSISQCVGDHSVRHGQPTNGHIPKKSDSLFP